MAPLPPLCWVVSYNHNTTFEQVATSEAIVCSLGSGVNVASISDFDSEGSGSTPEGPATLQSTITDPILGERQRAV